MAELLYASMQGRNADEGGIYKMTPTEITATENDAETTAEAIDVTIEAGDMALYIGAIKGIDVPEGIEPCELNEPEIALYIWNGEEKCGVFAGTWKELAEIIETARKAREKSETASD